jgi:hypothetical protein
MEGQNVLMKTKGQRPVFYVDNDDDDDMYAVEICEAKYDKVEINSVIGQQKHLNEAQ